MKNPLLAMTRLRQPTAALLTRPAYVVTPEGRSRDRYRRIIVTTLGSVGAKLVSIALLVISVPLTLGYLGREQFGLWMTISTTVGMLTFADLEIGMGLVNAIARAHGRGDRALAAREVSTALAVLGTVAAARRSQRWCPRVTPTSSLTSRRSRWSAVALRER